MNESTKKSLRENGFRFSGVYDRDKEKVNAEAEILKNKGYLKVRVVSDGSGYSVYTKYKPLKGELLEEVKGTLKMVSENIAINDKTLSELEKQRELINEKIKEVLTEKSAMLNQAHELVFQLRDSGVPNEEIKKI